MIYHITHKKDWAEAVKNKVFKTNSLTVEGFIHCSPLEKLIETANRFFKNEKEVLILSIDESKVRNKILWEDLYNHNFNFPHIYGELNTDAICKVSCLVCDRDGRFGLPENF